MICKFCNKPITKLQRVWYFFKTFYNEHLLFYFGFTNIGGGRITDSYWYWKDVMNISKGKVYFHLGCENKDYKKRYNIADKLIKALEEAKKLEK